MPVHALSHDDVQHIAYTLNRLYYYPASIPPEMPFASHTSGSDEPNLARESFEASPIFFAENGTLVLRQNYVAYEHDVFRAMSGEEYLTGQLLAGAGTTRLDLASFQRLGMDMKQAVKQAINEEVGPCPEDKRLHAFCVSTTIPIEEALTLETFQRRVLDYVAENKVERITSAMRANVPVRASDEAPRNASFEGTVIARGIKGYIKTLTEGEQREFLGAMNQELSLRVARFAKRPGGSMDLGPPG